MERRKPSELEAFCSPKIPRAGATRRALSARSIRWPRCWSCKVSAARVGGWVKVQLGRDNRWAVENEGVAPDIDIENWPKDVIAGRDAQLERAVEEATRLLKLHPVDRATKEPPPPTWGVRPKR